MKPINKLTVVLSSIAVTMFLTGCFSYNRQDTRTSAPAVEAPSVTGPTASIEGEDGYPQRQRMTTYLEPWIMGSR